MEYVSIIGVVLSLVCLGVIIRINYVLNRCVLDISNLYIKPVNKETPKFIGNHNTKRNYKNHKKKKHSNEKAKI